MSALVRATRVEVLKLRRTLALWASVLVPLLVLGMTGANILARDTSGPLGNPQAGPWNSLTINFVFFLWCLVALPLLVALETALLAGVEHRENSWKHLFALPVPRWSLYTAKLVVASLLLAVSSLVLAIGVGLEGQVLDAVHPVLGLAPPVPWGPIFSAAATLLGSGALPAGDPDVGGDPLAQLPAGAGAGHRGYGRRTRAGHLPAVGLLGQHLSMVLAIHRRPAARAAGTCLIQYADQRPRSGHRGRVAGRRTWLLGRLPPRQRLVGRFRRVRLANTQPASPTR